MNPIKCEYCGTETLKINGNELICSQCGAPLKNVYALEIAPVYVLKCERVLSHEAMGHLREQWKSFFDGRDVPKLMILDCGIDIQALK
ncbi:MAG: hypothetical protein J0M11_03675 [Anaerolineae bacterium]|nr:hypothetical protein [Anaerolineae bacterium]